MAQVEAEGNLFSTSNCACAAAALASAPAASFGGGGWTFPGRSIWSGMGSLGAAGLPAGKRSSDEEGAAAGFAPGAEGASKSSFEFVAAAAGAGELGTSKSSALFAVGAGDGVAATVAGVGVAGVGLCAELRIGIASARQRVISLTNG